MTDKCCVYAENSQSIRGFGTCGDVFQEDPNAPWREDCIECGHARKCHETTRSQQGFGGKGMRVLYDRIVEEDGDDYHHSFVDVEPCCDAMEKAWKKNAVDFGDTWTSAEYGVRVIQPSWEGVERFQSPIKYCPWCGERVVMDSNRLLKRVIHEERVESTKKRVEYVPLDNEDGDDIPHPYKDGDE